MNKTVIVLGLARSGTSLAAGSLGILGVAMDTGADQRDRFAPGGYHESPGAIAINKKIYRLAAGGVPDYADDDIQYYWNPPPRDAVPRQADAVADDIRAFVAANARHALWGFKNPATCLTLELYLPHLDDPCFVVSHRDFDDNVAACRLIYKQYDEAHIRRVMAAYRGRLEATLASHGGRRLDLDYADFKRDHRAVAGRLAEFCGIAPTAEQLGRLDAFVDPDQFGLAKYRSRLARRRLEIKRAFRRFLGRA